MLNNQIKQYAPIRELNDTPDLLPLNFLNVLQETYLIKKRYSLFTVGGCLRTNQKD